MSTSAIAKAYNDPLNGRGPKPNREERRAADPALRAKWLAKWRTQQRGK